MLGWFCRRGLGENDRSTSVKWNVVSRYAETPCLADQTMTRACRRVYGACQMDAVRRHLVRSPSVFQYEVRRRTVLVVYLTSECLFDHHSYRGMAAIC